MAFEFKTSKAAWLNRLRPLVGKANDQAIAGEGALESDLSTTDLTCDDASHPFDELTGPWLEQDMGRLAAHLFRGTPASSPPRAKGVGGAAEYSTPNPGPNGDGSLSALDSESVFAGRVQLPEQSALASVSWLPDADGDWSQPGNWSGGALPGPDDNVSIATSSFHTVTHSIGNDAIHSLTVSGDLLSLSDGSLSISSTAVFNNGVFLFGGNLNLNGDSDIQGSCEIAGTLSVGANATVEFKGPVELDYGSLDGPGTITTSGTTRTGDTDVSLFGSLTWQNTGTLVLSDDYADVGSIYDTSTVLINHGTIEKAQGTAASQIEVSVDSDGTLTSASGVLEFDGGGTFSGVLDGAGFVDFGAGTSTLGGATGFSAVNLEISGGSVLFPDAQTTVSGTFYQTGGLVSIASGDTLSLTGPNILSPAYSSDEVDGSGTLVTTGATTISAFTTFSSGGFVLGGGLTWLNTGRVNCDQAITGGNANGETSTLLNVAGAEIDLTADAAGIFDYRHLNPQGTLTLINHGTLAKTGGNGASAVDATVTSTGTFTSDTGTLQFDGGGTFSGVFDGQGVVAFGGYGTSTLGGISHLSAGNLEVDSGNVVLDSQQTSIAGTLNQAGGTISVTAGNAINIADLDLSGIYDYTVLGGPGSLTTTGTSFIGSGFHYLADGLVWLNVGTVDITTIYGLEPFEGSASSLINQGTLTKTGDGGASDISVVVNSTGTITSGSGTLQFSGGGTFSGVFNGQGVIGFGGYGTSTLGGSSGLSVINMEVDSGYVLFDDNQTAVTGTLDQTGGTIGIEAGSTVSVADFDLSNGPETVLYGSGTLTTIGTSFLDGDDHYLDGGLVWRNVGFLGVTNDGGLANDYADDPSSSFINQGTIAKTGDSSASTISVALTNSGTVQAQTGTMVLSASVNNTGVLQATTGGDLDVSGTLTGSGSFVIDVGSEGEIGSATSESVSFTGAGTLQLDSPSDFTGTIYGITPGAEIILGGSQVTGTSLSGSLLTLTLAGGGSYALAIAGVNNVNDLSLSDNVLTGTNGLQEAVPDLVVSSITAPPNVQAGGTATIDCTDSNQGALTAAGPWTDQVFLVSDAEGDNPQLLGSLEFDGTLATNQSVDRSLQVSLPSGVSGSEYFLVKTDALNQVPNDGTGPGRQDVTGPVNVLTNTAPIPTPPSIAEVTPNSGSNLGNVTVTIDGAQLTPGDQVAVVGPDGAAHDATSVRYVSSGQVYATFDLQGLPTGTYDVQVTDAAGSATLPGGFTVNDGPAGTVSVNLILPNITTDESGTGTIVYSNPGDTDVAAPILDLSSTQATLSASGVTGDGGDLILLGTNPNGPAGILQPGAEASITFTYTPTAPTPNESLGVTLSTTTPGATIDWASLEDSLRPPTVDATDWHNVFTQFVARVGTTTDSLTAALSQDATELGQVGQPTDDVATLLQDELFQASGALAGTYLANASDIAPTSSSLSLSLDRFYDGTLLSRDSAGAFGDGWTSTYDVSAVTDADGNVYVQSPGVLHVFTLQADGTYTAQPGDPSSLTLSGGQYRLTDGSGDVEQFRADGKLGSATDANGNTIALAYGSNGVLQTVTNQTTGETITFASNAEGRITSATDSDGRAVTYTYDSSGTQLLTATGPDGTTTYTYAATYAAPTGAAQDNALTSITNPDGTHTYFTYDAQGRLATQSGDNGVGLQTYSYANPGEVTVTDALGHATTLLYGANGSVAETQDALGNVTRLQSNAAGELTGAVTAGGDVYRYAYDGSGNLTSYTDPLGGTVFGSYPPGTSDLTGFTDQNGNQTHYTYDASGNVTGIVYQDGSGSTYQYDTSGLLKSSTDADGYTIQYSYDAAGDLTGKLFGDGTSDTYTYDSHGNLMTATAQDGGTTSYTYDSADRLTSVTDAQGRLESYTYNAQGELATRTLPDGSVTQYSYDGYGRLTELQDGAGNLLDKYTYNAAGQLVRTDTGNGASTTYAYDVASNVTEILDRNADGSVASQFDYTYDANGQVVHSVTTDGTWNYSYDAEGELINAVFASTNASIQDQDITYVYDAAGNRVSQTINGIVSNYTTNILNQYTAVGGATYTYDADGNTISKTGPSGTTDYTYNDDNKLLSETGPSGTFAYTYDALGNLVSVSQNGSLSSYVNDPLAVSIAGNTSTAPAEILDASGDTSATLNYGLGASSIDNDGTISYFEADAAGNINGLSGPNGSLDASYVYSPFGTLSGSSGDVANPLQFGGLFGVLSENDSLISMRARSYDPANGRFLTEDPTGISGGANLYAYTANDPINYVDPNGTDAFSFLGVPVGYDPTFNTTGIYQDPVSDEFFKEYFEVLSGAGLAGLSFGSGTLLGAAAEIYDGIAYSPELLDAFNFVRSNPIAAAAGGYYIPGEATEGLFSSNVKVYKAYGGLLSKFFTYVYPGSTILTSTAGKIASLFPDPHLSTFDGLYYSFQTAGEFVLARDTNGGTLQVQARLSAPVGASTYSVITEIGVQVGADRVTIDSTRANAVWVDGAPVTFTSGVINLAAGEIVQTPSGYQILLNTGETVTANINSTGTQSGPTTTSYGISTSISLSPTAQPDSVQGLLGNDNGNANNDLTLADGTVLPTNIPLSILYGAYADAWRVTQPTSLLDYGPGQTTDTFTDREYPNSQITLASFPQQAIDHAEALAMQAGITDPGLVQAAAYDYLVTGDTSTFTVEANEQQQGVTTAAQTDFVPPTAPAEVGILATAPTEVEAASGPTTTTFQIYRSGDMSGPVTVGYSVVAPDGTFLGASDFGGTLPSGTITLTAGQDEADLSITLPGNIGAVASKTLEVEVTAPAPAEVIGQYAQTTIENNAPTAGAPPVFAAELVNDPGVLPTVTGNTYTFDLGSFRAGMGDLSAPIELALLNDAPAGSDGLSATITGSGNGSLTAIALPSFNDLAPGAMLDVAYLTVRPDAVASGSATLTFALQDVNATGYAAALPTETVVLTDELVQPAQAALSTTSVDFGAVRVGTALQRQVALQNTAPAGAETLDVGIAGVSGAGLGSGTISMLAPGQASNTVTVGLDTSASGAVSGAVTLGLATDGTNVDSLGTAALPSQTVSVTGTVYAEAQGTLSLAAPVVVHVGDAGTVPLVLSNAAGDVENLLASVTGVTGGFSASLGTLPEISAGNTATLPLGFSTTTAGVISGSVAVSYASDGAGTDGAPVTTIGTQTLDVSATVDNYASSVLATSAGDLSFNGTEYVLNLGTITQGSTPLSAMLSVTNGSTGPADLLSGTVEIDGDNGLANDGAGTYTGLAAGASASPETISLDTSTAGTFSETLVLHSTGSNASGYSGALADQQVLVTGTVTPTGSATGDVHLVTFDGLHYDFQADGNYVLACSTNPANPFQIQISTAPYAANNAASITTELAAQVGRDVVCFGTSGAPIVSVNGVADITLAASTPVQQLDDGTLTLEADGSYELTWNGGEELTVTNEGFYLNSSVTLGPNDAPGSVAGLLGSDTGQAKDFTLPDGTVLQQPLSTDQILGPFATAWQVAPDDSLLSGVLPTSSMLGLLNRPTFIGQQTNNTTSTTNLGQAAVASDPAADGNVGGIMAGITAETATHAQLAGTLHAADFLPSDARNALANPHEWAVRERDNDAPHGSLHSLDSSANDHAPSDYGIHPITLVRPL